MTELKLHYYMGKILGLSRWYLDGTITEEVFKPLFKEILFELERELEIIENKDTFTSPNIKNCKSY